MMHELAHCKQMNHSKFFWQVRNRYMDHMKELWVKKYEGEGLWGRGQDLTSGAFVHERMPKGDDVPEHLCGGTYRRGGRRKRKRGQDGDKPTLSYAERQQKRIAKKFGKHGEGQGLGEDELVRGALEQGKRHQGKPKVAGSKRGRELRANAALARFDAAKAQQQWHKEHTPKLDDGSDTESDDDEWDNGLPILEELGGSMKDEQGRDLFKLCGDEEDGDGAGDEFAELMQMGSQKPSNGNKRPQKKLYEDSETESESEDPQRLKAGPRLSGVSGRLNKAAKPSARDSNGHNDATSAPPPDSGFAPPAVSSTVDESAFGVVTCQVCSLDNDSDSPTCLACANVLKPRLVPNCWHCKSDACKDSKYINAGDAGRCGLCSTQKPAANAVATINGARPPGLIGSEVLRWD